MSLEVKKRFVIFTRKYSNALGETIIQKDIKFYCTDFWIEKNEKTDQMMLCFRTYRGDGTVFDIFKYPEEEIVKMMALEFRPKKKGYQRLADKAESNSDEDQLDKLQQQMGW